MDKDSTAEHRCDTIDGEGKVMQKNALARKKCKHVGVTGEQHHGGKGPQSRHNSKAGMAVLP